MECRKAVRIDAWSLTRVQQRRLKTRGRLIKARHVLLTVAGRGASAAAALWPEALISLGSALVASSLRCLTRGQAQKGNHEVWRVGA
jgi:hypothetical protein